MDFQFTDAENAHGEWHWYNEDENLDSSNDRDAINRLILRAVDAGGAEQAAIDYLLRMEKIAHTVVHHIMDEGEDCYITPVTHKRCDADIMGHWCADLESTIEG